MLLPYDVLHRANDSSAVTSTPAAVTFSYAYISAASVAATAVAPHCFQVDCCDCSYQEPSISLAYCCRLLCCAALRRAAASAAITVDSDAVSTTSFAAASIAPRNCQIDFRTRSNQYSALARYNHDGCYLLLLLYTLVSSLLSFGFLSMVQLIYS